MSQITHVAIKYNGRIWSLPRPYRHNHVIHMMVILSKTYGAWTGDNWNSISFGENDEDGFLATAEGGSQVFLNRKDAFIFAKANNLLNDSPIYGEELYSENLW